MKKLFGFLLVVAVVGGLAWGVHTGMAGPEWQNKLANVVDDVKSQIDNPPANQPPANLPVAANQPDPGKTTPPANTAGDPKTVAGAGEPKIAPASLAQKAAETALTTAEQMYAAARFEDAHKALQPVLNADVDKPIAARAATLAARARAAADVLDDISDAERASNTDMVDVILLSGNPMRGQLISETPAEVTIKKQGGIVFTMSKAKVKEVKRLDPKQLQESLETEVATRLKRISAPTATDFYDLAVYCYRNRLDGRVGELVDKALAKDPALVKTLHQTKGKNIYEAYVWFTGRGNNKDAQRMQELLLNRYGDTPYATMLKETIVELASAQTSGGATIGGTGPDAGTDGASGTAETPQERDPGLASSSNEEARAKVAQANKLYDEGMAHFDKAEPGSPNRKEENRKAFECFNQALALYDEAYALSGGDNGIARRMDQTRAVKVLTFRRQKALN